MKDERYKQIMNDLGYPENRSLLQALQQVANEVAQEKNAEQNRFVCKLFEGLTNIANNTDHKPNEMHKEAERLLLGIRNGFNL